MGGPGATGEAERPAERTWPCQRPRGVGAENLSVQEALRLPLHLQPSWVPPREQGRLDVLRATLSCQVGSWLCCISRLRLPQRPGSCPHPSPEHTDETPIFPKAPVNRTVKTAQSL